MAEASDAARALHDEHPAIDLHADTLMWSRWVGYDLHKHHEPPLFRAAFGGHVDLPRMREGGQGAQFFGLVSLPLADRPRGMARTVMEQIDQLDAQIVAKPGSLRLVKTAGELEACNHDGAIAALLGIEGAHALEGDLDNVGKFARRGVRYIGILHFSANEAGRPAFGRGRDDTLGLTPWGFDLVQRCEDEGVLVDLAHVNRAGFLDACRIAKKPPIVSHTGVLGAFDHWRNIDDEQLRAVADKGGVIGVIFCPRYVGGDGLEPVVKHLQHIVDVVGEDCAAFGSDWDGFIVPTRELKDPRGLPLLTDALLAAGMSKTTIGKILRENVMRVLREAYVPRAFSPGEVLAGGYTIEGAIERGGHSAIYAARDVSDGKAVAVKVLDPEGLNEHARARFVREAAIHRKLKSQHVARVLEAYDLDDTTGLYGGAGRLVFIVMERLSGESAEKRVKREGPQPIERAISWILDACEALEEAHAAGVVHRDLKPANLFLVRGPDRPSMVKLLDFGIARLRDDDGITGGRLTTSTSVFGSPAYMAPEQLLSTHKADHRADIYGLGATLFELVSGQVPFPAKNIADMTANIIRDPPRSARGIRPEVPVSLDRIILKCLAKNPNERFQTIVELRDALLAVLVDPKEAPKTVFESKPPALAVAHARKDRQDRTLRKQRSRARIEIALTAFAAMMLVILAGATIFLLMQR